MMHNSNAQHGAILLLSLLFLMALTIMSLSTITIVSLDERMVSSFRDKNLSFQMAETALAAGESWLKNHHQSNRLNGFINENQNSAQTTELLKQLSSTHTSSQDALYTAIPVKGLSDNQVNAPRFFVEYLGQLRDHLILGDQHELSGIHFYQISARGEGRGVDSQQRARAVTFAQSTYSLRLN